MASLTFGQPSMIRHLLLLLLCCLFSGCEKPIVPDYDASFAGPVLELRLPDDAAETLDRMHFDEKVQVSERLAFSGQVTWPNNRPKLAKVRLYKKMTDGNIVVAGSAIARLGEVIEDEIEYRVELPSPRKPGTYDVEVRLGDRIVALAQIKVKT